MLLVAAGHEAEACLFLDRSEVGNGEFNKHFKPAFSLGLFTGRRKSPSGTKET